MHDLKRVIPLLFKGAFMDALPDEGVTQNEHDHAIAERMRVLHSNAPLMFCAALAVAFLLVIFLWSYVPHAYLLAWFFILSVWNLRGLRILAGIRKAPPTTPEWALLDTRYAIGAAVAGGIWGLGIAAFFSLVPLTQQAIILTIVVMLAAGALSGSSTSYRACAAFLGPLLLPTVLVCVLLGGLLYNLVATALLAMLLICGRFAYMQVRSLDVNVQLRVHNEQLAGALTLANIRLEEVNMAKTRFLAAASHDLRQPMHALGLFVGALRAHVSTTAGLAIMRKIELSVEALANLFNTILDISKLDARAVAPQVEEFPLAAIFGTIALLYTPQAAAKGLALRFRHTDCVVRSDPELLDRILRNLVSNAIRYTEHGRVLVGLRHRGESVEILVCDTGIGIPPDRRNEIFKEFVQLANPTHDRSRGLGLGLSIVERIAKLLGHEIRLCSKLGCGSCFSVRVPRVATPEIPHDSGAPLRSAPSKLTGAFIVVVDDEEGILMGMEALLTAYGCHCLSATSSGGLLEKLEDHLRQPDLIITDFRIGPRETGLDVIHAVREAQQLAVPALIVTGSQGAEDLRAAGESGFRVIQKPVLERELVAVISELLGAATNNHQSTRP